MLAREHKNLSFIRKPTFKQPEWWHACNPSTINQVGSWACGLASLDYLVSSRSAKDSVSSKQTNKWELGSGLRGYLVQSIGRICCISLRTCIQVISSYVQAGVLAIYNPRARSSASWIPGGHWLVSLALGPLRVPALKTMVERDVEGTWQQSLASHTPAHTCTHTYLNTCI